MSASGSFGGSLTKSLSQDVSGFEPRTSAGERSVYKTDFVAFSQQIVPDL